MTVLPGAVGGRDGARRERARARAVPVRRLPAAGRAALAALWEELARWPHGRSSRSSRRSGCRGRSRSLAAALPERRVAVCRELTKAHEEIVRGHGRGGRASGSREPPKGEIVLVLGPRATAVRGRRGRGARRRSRSSSRRALAPRQAAELVARLTACRATRSTGDLCDELRVSCKSKLTTSAASRYRVASLSIHVTTRR